jgi:chromatin structure-remodeling complex subunit SFH1
LMQMGVSNRSESRLLEHATKKSVLVPIRIELDTETHRIRDCFMWDLSGSFLLSTDLTYFSAILLGKNARLLHLEPFLTPEMFAQTFCDDVGLVSHSYRDQVASSIRAQIDELTGVAEIPLLTPEQEADNAEVDLRVVVNVGIASPSHLVLSVRIGLTGLGGSASTDRCPDPNAAPNGQDRMGPLITPHA